MSDQIGDHAAVRARRDLPREVAARVPVALATMHLCWGTGFLMSPRRLARAGRG